MAHGEWSGSFDIDLFGVSSRVYEDYLGAAVVGQSINSLRNSSEFPGPWRCASYDDCTSWRGGTSPATMTKGHWQPDAHHGDDSDEYRKL